MRTIGRIRTAILLFAFLGLSIGWLAFSQQTGRNDEPAFDPEAYTALMAAEVLDIYELERILASGQQTYLPVIPPGPDFILRQSGPLEVVPFVWSNFPEEFLRGLVVEYQYSVPIYFVNIAEDPVTRATKFFNRHGTEIYSLPAPADYEPFAYLKSLRPGLYIPGRYAADVTREYEALYDPARIQMHVRLIPSDHVEPYLHARQQVRAYEDAMLTTEDEDEGFMMLMGMEDHIVITEIAWTTNGPQLEIGYPDGFTNRLEVFFATDLLERDWRLASGPLTTVGTNSISWFDQNDWIAAGAEIGFYAVGNYDMDSDGDGIPDAREIFVYKSDPHNPDTSGDGMSDGTAVDLGFDPTISNVAVQVWINSPPDGRRWP